MIVGHSQGSSIAAPSLAEQLVLVSGRPVVCVPGSNGHAAVGKHVLLAWNQTREASRAVADALPILERADKVTVTTVHTPMTGAGVAADFLDYLSRHGVQAEGHHEIAPDARIGDALVEAADKHEVDLIVMGAYGHSRLREVAFGGATRHVLGHASVPVLMSH